MVILRIKLTRNIHKMMLGILHRWQLSIISGAMSTGAKRIKGRQENLLHVLERYSTV